jgi:hypothetical protein
MRARSMHRGTLIVALLLAAAGLAHPVTVSRRK